MKNPTPILKTDLRGECWHMPGVSGTIRRQTVVGFIQRHGPDKFVINTCETLLDNWQYGYRFIVDRADYERATS